MIASTWKVFTKAGQKGWLALIPVLNIYVLIKVVGRESWWIIFYPMLAFGDARYRGDAPPVF